MDHNQWILENKQSLIPLEKWQKTVNLMSRIFKTPAGFIVQHTASGYQVVIASQQETNPYPVGAFVPSDSNIFCRKIIETKKMLYVQDARIDSYWNDNPEVIKDGFISYYGLPIHWPNDLPFGTICVLDLKVTNYHQDYLDLMEELRDLVEKDLLLINQYDTVAKLAFHDELTDLYNRRGFLTMASQRLMLANHSHQLLGLLYLDMDGLKRINDQQGHQKGDLALQNLARVITETIDTGNVAARLGGDEFAILVNCNSEQKLRNFQEDLVSNFNKLEISVSLGSVLIDNPNLGIDHWLLHADKKMYIQKHNKKENSHYKSNSLG